MSDARPCGRLEEEVLRRGEDENVRNPERVVTRIRLLLRVRRAVAIRSGGGRSAVNGVDVLTLTPDFVNEYLNQNLRMQLRGPFRIFCVLKTDSACKAALALPRHNAAPTAARALQRHHC